MTVEHRGLRAGLLLACLALPASATPYALGEVDFSRCELGGQALAPPLPAQCATLELPADPGDPAAAGKTLPIRIAVLPARDSRPLSEALLFIAGGPGQSALQSFPQLAPALDRSNQSRHIVLVDQRGTGASAPLGCTEAVPTEGVDPTAAETATRHCLAQLQHDPRWFTTALAVADLEALRQRLGITRFDLYGVSYGTRVALEYMRRHPTAIRTAVLDGVVAPQRVLGVDFGQRLDAALTRLFAQCAVDPTCHQRFPDSFGALRVLKAQLAIRPVLVSTAHPRSGEPVQQELRSQHLAGLVRLYAYAAETQALLPLVIDQAARGHFGPLLAQSMVLEEQLEGALSVGMQLSVLCSEDLAAPIPEVSAAERESLLGGELASALARQCALWPRGRVAADFHAPVHSTLPVLLLSGELDPVTPPADAEHVLKDLPNGRHLIAKGQGHNVLPRGCMPKLVAEFIAHADVGELDVRCLDALAPTPFFLNANGAAP